MRFLLEFNEYDESDIFGDKDMLEEIKYAIKEFILSEVDDESVPQISPGHIGLKNLESGDVYFYPISAPKPTEIAIHTNNTKFNNSNTKRLGTILGQISDELCFWSNPMHDIISSNLFISTRKNREFLKMICEFGTILSDVCEMEESIFDKWRSSIVMEYNHTENSIIRGLSHNIIISKKAINGDMLSPSLEVKFSVPSRTYQILGDVIKFRIHFDETSEVILDIKNSKIVKSIVDSTIISSKRYTKGVYFEFNINDTNESIYDSVSRFIIDNIFEKFRDIRVNNYEKFISLFDDLENQGIKSDFRNIDGGIITPNRMFNLYLNYKGKEKQVRVMYDDRNNKISINNSWNNIASCTTDDFIETIFLLMT